MTVSRLRGSEQGFVIVPVMALLAVALGLGLALLAIVDTQTSQGRTQRMSDAAQTLAEGVASATANVLAADPSGGSWPTAGGCQTVNGDLSTAPSGLPTSLPYRVAAEIQARFSGTSADYASATRATVWRVDVCPIAAGDSRWSDTFLTRTVGPGTPTPPITVWVRGQASVRTVGSAQDRRTRAVATKVRQSGLGFAPPLGFAVGTGSFSTDLSTGVHDPDQQHRPGRRAAHQSAQDEPDDRPRDFEDRSALRPAQYPQQPVVGLLERDDRGRQHRHERAEPQPARRDPRNQSHSVACQLDDGPGGRHRRVEGRGARHRGGLQGRWRGVGERG